MRKLFGIAIIAFLSFAQTAMAEEKSCTAMAEVPNAGNRAVLRVDGKNILLNYQTPEVVTSQSGLTNIGSALTFGAIRAKMTDSLKIKGGKASVIINNRTPEFLDLFVPLGQTPEEVFYLVKLTPNKDSRLLEVSSVSAGLTGMDANSSSTKGRLSVIMEAVGTECVWTDNSQFQHYILKPTSPLPNGEYALFYQNLFFSFAVAGG